MKHNDFKKLGYVCMPSYKIKDQIENWQFINLWHSVTIVSKQKIFEGILIRDQNSILKLLNIVKNEKVKINNKRRYSYPQCSSIIRIFQSYRSSSSDPICNFLLSDILICTYKTE